MSDEMYYEVALERSIHDRFGGDLDVRQMIAAHLPISRTGEATVFLTTKKQLYVYITGQSKFLLGDIKKIVARMGLKAEEFVPPKGRPHYFDEIGREKFHAVFPGRTHITDQDILFYRTLAPYNPALVQIATVDNGEIYQFDTDSNTGWRLAKKFTYRRIKTS